MIRLSRKNIIIRTIRNDVCSDPIFVDERLLSHYNQERTDTGPPVGSSDRCCALCSACWGISADLHQEACLVRLTALAYFGLWGTVLEWWPQCILLSWRLGGKVWYLLSGSKQRFDSNSAKKIYLTGSNAPWMNPLIKYLIDRWWEAYRSRNRSLFNSLKVKVKLAITKACLFNKKNDSAKELWSFINMDRGNNGKSFVHTSSPEKILNELNEHFSTHEFRNHIF